MKRIILIAFCAIIATSCSKYSSNQNGLDSNIKKTTRTTYSNEQLLNNIGMIHNQIMEFAFNKIKNEHLFNTFNSESDAITFSTNATHQFMLSQNIVDPSITTVNQLLAAYDNNLGMPENQNQTYTNAVNQILNLVETYTGSPSQFNQDATILFNSNFANISDPIEQNSYRATYLVAVSSYQYWFNNLDKWNDEYYDQTGSRKAKPPTAGEVGKADAVGAAIWGYSGAVSGTFIIPGIGSLAGGILGASYGAAICSLTKAIVG
ncbi:MAG: hypothetical protein KA198_00065 [Chitinophagaceae bacterium]|nr:hypothetical protein [Chitinophagaceae bacterium]